MQVREKELVNRNTQGSIINLHVGFRDATINSKYTTAENDQYQDDDASFHACLPYCLRSDYS